MNKGKYLGLDFGDRRVGVAISDVDKSIVFPREAITYERSADLLTTLQVLCTEESVTKIVIGLPIQMDGTIGEQVAKTYEFGKKLSTALPNMSVEYFDERLTTQEAQIRLHAQGIKAKDQKGLKDSLSAQLILETYLESRR
ncbi:MAG: Holliday junction resolvase RuvX [Candidatus Peregrinibacteria bacterium]